MGEIIMSCEEAIGKYVRDGDTIAVGGFTVTRKPYALIREIVRQGRRNLVVEGSGGGGEIDLLIGAGCVRALINAYMANAVFGNVSPRFRRAIERGEIKFEDYTLDVQPLRFHAAALGLPYLPVWGSPARAGLMDRRVVAGRAWHRIRGR
ncbi:MAG: CoA transferase subunit A [Moorellales bacterium]